MSSEETSEETSQATSQETGEETSEEKPERGKDEVIAGKFRVVRQLGKGGMGAVYEVVHTLTHKRMAVKIMLSFADDSETVRQRFFREARAACAIRHPAIVPVHDLIEQGDGIILVMDLLEGRTLFDLQELQPGRRLHPLMAVEHILPIASALGTMHAAGFIHRDIKPENIFVTQQGSFLLDLGIVKDTRGPTVTRLTTDGGIGTPLYMSPEQAFNRPFDHRVDIWSLGLVLYEAIAGQVPTMASSMGAIYQLIGSANFKPLAEAVPGVPESLAKLVDSMIAEDPDRRPPSMQAVFDVLSGHANSGLLSRYPRPEGAEVDLRQDDAPKRQTVSDPAVGNRPSLELIDTNQKIAAALPATARVSATLEAPPMTTPTMLPKQGRSRLGYALFAGLSFGLLSLVAIIGLKLSRADVPANEPTTVPADRPPEDTPPTEEPPTAPSVTAEARESVEVVVDPAPSASVAPAASSPATVPTYPRVTTGANRPLQNHKTTPTATTTAAPAATPAVKLYFP